MVILETCRAVLQRAGVSERRPGREGDGHGMTWADLIAEVRAQIDVDDDQALEWLLDRARVMNAAAGWLLREADPRSPRHAGVRAPA
jgi:hypothetical protein